MDTAPNISYTYRGYRLQALYALWRILESTDDCFFQPEGKEDLAVLDSSDNLVEAIQVKAHSTPLTLSSLQLGESNSFFRRASLHMKENSNTKITIASFGKIGDELIRAVNKPGKERDSVVSKVSEKENITKQQALNIVQNLEVLEINEDKTTNDVFDIIKKRMVDSQSAFENLTAWLYRCSEEKTKVSRKRIIDKIESIGKFLTDRASHLKEWGTSIVPINESDYNADNYDELKEEYYRGISARYEHILSDLDAPRSDKLISIAEGFKSKRVVILHGASGQGKSTLAYRYLHDYYPGQWRYGIKLVEDRQHALSIASALSGYSSAVGLPIIAFIDVSGNDKGWEDLVKHLYEHKNILVLVAIREEDYRRANFDKSDFEYAEIELYFDKAEANLIYESLSAIKLSYNFLDFEASWSHCGNDVPLLEFVHLITQGKSLKDRLKEQINRIRDEVRNNPHKANELEALRLVAVASAYEAKLNIDGLSRLLELPDPSRTFELFEKEYLLRLSDNNELVYGLHPIRSQILTDLLTDSTLNSWKDAAIKCIPLMPENHYENLFLYAFSRRYSDSPQLVEYLNTYEPTTWTGIAGILRALQWLGIKEYVDENESVINNMYALFGNSSPVFLDCDLTNTTANALKNLFENTKLFPMENIEAIRSAKAKQTDKMNALKYVKKWIESDINFPNYFPTSDIELCDMAYAFIWIGQFCLEKSIQAEIANDELEVLIGNSNIEILGNLILGLSFAPGCNLNKQFKSKTHLLRKKYMTEMQTFKLEENNGKITAHFIIDLFDVNPSDSDKQSEGNKFHDEALSHIRLLRNLFPDKELYACQGYGHQFLQLPIDDTLKSGINKSLFPPTELAFMNTVFRGRMLYNFRPSDWQEYVTMVTEIRENVIKCSRQVLAGVNKYYAMKTALNIYEEYIDIDLWDKTRNNLSNPPMLPKCAVDEWGFVSEGNAPNAANNDISQMYANHIFDRYKNLLTATSVYFQSLYNYFLQSQQSFIITPYVGRNNKTQDEIIELANERDIELYPHYIRLSLNNLNDAVKSLPFFQQQFRHYLKSFVDQEQLNSLIAEESEIMGKLLPLWYFFTQKPKLSAKNAIDKFTEKFEKKKKEILRHIKHGIKKIEPRDLVKIKLNDSVKLWNDKKAFIIISDFEKPYDSISVLENMLQIIHAAVNKVESNEMRRITLEQDYEYFVIIPLIQGKSMNGNAWKFYCHSLPDKDLKDENVSLWKYAPEDIPNDVFNMLGLSTWDLPRLNTAWELVRATQELVFYIKHLSEFADLEDLDDTGKAVLQDYVNRLATKAGATFQNVFDYALDMYNYSNTIPDESKNNRKHLAGSIAIISDLIKLLNPSGEETVHMAMDVNGIKEASIRLTDAPGLAISAYWHWAADAIEHEGSVVIQKYAPTEAVS
jgi:hypothetical protein